jgi:hypothetical protein
MLCGLFRIVSYHVIETLLFSSDDSAARDDFVWRGGHALPGPSQVLGHLLQDRRSSPSGSCSGREFSPQKQIPRDLLSSSFEGSSCSSPGQIALMPPCKGLHIPLTPSLVDTTFFPATRTFGVPELPTRNTTFSRICSTLMPFTQIAFLRPLT